MSAATYCTLAKVSRLAIIEHIAQARNQTLKIFWVVCSVVLICVTIYQVTGLVLQLNSNAVLTSIRIKTHPTKPFPAVTICSLNPYKRSALLNLPEFQSLFDAYNATTNEQARKKRNNMKPQATVRESASILKRQKRFDPACIAPQDGNVYMFINNQYGCALDSWNCRRQQSMVTYPNDSSNDYEQFYLKLIPGTTNNFMMFLTCDTTLCVDSSPNPSQQIPTCAISQQFSFANGINCAYYIYPSSGPSNMVFTDAGQTSICNFNPAIAISQNANNSNQLWTLKQLAITWPGTLPACYTSLSTTAPITTSTTAPITSTQDYQTTTTTTTTTAITTTTTTQQSITQATSVPAVATTTAKSTATATSATPTPAKGPNMETSEMVTSTISPAITNQKAVSTTSNENATVTTFSKNSPIATSATVTPTGGPDTATSEMETSAKSAAITNQKAVSTTSNENATVTTFSKNSPIATSATVTPTGGPDTATSEMETSAKSAAMTSQKAALTSSNYNATITTSSKTAATSTALSQFAISTKFIVTSNLSKTATLKTSSKPAVVTTSPVIASLQSSTLNAVKSLLSTSNSTAIESTSTSTTIDEAITSTVSKTLTYSSSTSLKNPITKVTITTSTTKSDQVPALTVQDIMQILNLNNNTDSMSKSATVNSAIPYIASSLPASVRMQLGYDLGSVMLHCTFDGKNCDKNDFVKWNDPSIGNCFTFNHVLGIKHSTDYAGVKHGLSLLFNASQNEYLQTTLSGGLIVYITYNNATIFPDLTSFSLPPGYFMDVSVHYQYIKRLQPCIAEKLSENYFYDGEYSDQGCIKTCYQKRVMTECGCGDPSYPLPLVIPQIYQSCTLIKKPCVDSISSSNEIRNQNCSCPQQCLENVFSSTPTVTKARIGYNTDLATINVYHDTMLYLYLQETPAYDFGAFYSDFCNVLDNYLEIGFHSVIEIVCLVFLIFGSFLRMK